MNRNDFLYPISAAFMEKYIPILEVAQEQELRASGRIDSYILSKFTDKPAKSEFTD